MKVAKIHGEDDDFKRKREKALNDAAELSMPESIRTPGRTWTRIPEELVEEVENVEPVIPEIETEGDVEVYTEAGAIEKAGDRLLNAVKADENRIHAVHTALMNSVVYVKVTGEADVKIKYDEDRPVFSHLVVDTDQSAELTITEYFEGSPEILTSIGEFYVGKNAKVTYGSVQSVENGFDYAARNAVVERDGQMDWLNSLFGAEISKHRFETVLKGDNSTTDKTAVMYSDREQHHDVSFRVRHRAENTTCDMKTRGVIDDSARSCYEGLQDVGDHAEETSSFQRENTLILSDKAEVDASPKLMIDNNDVEASHAASAGQLPQDQLYYMESRGMSQDQAQRLVVKGFFEPIMDEIPLPDLKEEVREQVEKKLER